MWLVCNGSRKTKVASFYGVHFHNISELINVFLSSFYFKTSPTIHTIIVAALFTAVLPFHAVSPSRRQSLNTDLMLPTLPSSYLSVNSATNAVMSDRLQTMHQQILSLQVSLRCLEVRQLYIEIHVSICCNQ